MKDPSGTNQELIKKISVLKQRIQELEQLKLAAYEKGAAPQLISEEFRRLANRSRDGIYRYDLTTRQFLFVNKAFLEFYGIDTEGDREVTTKSVLLSVYPEDRDKVKKARDESLAPGSTGGEVEYCQTRPDGSLHWMDDRWIIITDETGNPVTIEGIVRDKTKRKRTEEKYQSLFEQSPNGILLIDIETGKTIEANETACKQLGYTREEFAALRISDYEVLEKPEEIAKHIQKIIHDGSDDFETLQRTKSGEIRNVHVWAKSVQLGDRSLFYAIFQDTTKHKQAEAALRESEQMRRLVLDNIDEVVYFVEMGADNMLTSRVRFVSGRTEKILGYQPEEFIRDRELWLSNIHPDDVPALVESTQAIFASGQPGIRKYRMRNKGTGDYRWMEDHIVPELDSAGVVIGQFGVARDVTESRQAGEALRESEARYRVIAEATADVIIVIDEDSRITFTNDAIANVFGYTRDEIIGQSLTRLMPEGLRPAHLAGLKRYLDTGRRSLNWKAVEVRGRHKSGREFPIEVSFGEISRDGKYVFAGIIRDITERKRRERKREVIATLAAALRTAPTRAEMLPVILDQLLILLKADGALLAMRNPATSGTIIELGRGRAGVSFTGVRLPPGEGIAGYVIMTSQPYLNNVVQSDPRFHRTDLLPPDIHAVAYVPLIVQGQTIGALCLLHARDIDDDEIRLLTTIADIVANAINRATLYEQTERHLQRLTALRAIDTAISASLDLRVTLNILLDQTTTHLQVDAADILLLNPYAQTLNYAAGRGFRGDAITRSHLRLGEGQAGKAALERHTIYIPNLVEEANFVRSGLLANENFVAYFAVPLIAKGQVKGVLETFHRTPYAPEPEWLDFLETLAGQAAIALDNAELFDGLQRSNTELVLAYDTTIEGWSRALDLRDKETEGHSLRVTEMTERLARALGLSETEIVHIRRGALLHDIGKMGVPDGILLKPDKLTDAEWVLMRQHPIFAYELLAPTAYLRPALDIPYCHHEKWDGAGYPRGLKGEQIPLAARIFAIVDIWDALRSDRPYRPAWPEEKAREYIKELAGKQFDPKVVEAFFELLKG